MFQMLLYVHKEFFFEFECYTEKPFLSGHTKLDKRKILKANGRLMKVGSVAECSLEAFCNTFDLH